MLLNLSSYKSLIQEEIKLLNQLKYKLNNQLRNFKQLQHIKLINKHIHQLFILLSPIQSYNPKQGNKILQLKQNINKSIELITSIKSRIKSQGHRTQLLIQNGKFIQLSTIIFGSISRIYSNLDIIQSKIQFISNAINKIKQSKQKNIISNNNISIQKNQSIKQ